MKISRIESIALDIPYQEHVREPLRKGWSYANRATDEEFAADAEGLLATWKAATAPSVKTTLYQVFDEDGRVGLGEGKALTADELAVYSGHSPFEYLGDDSVGPLQMAFYDLMGQITGLPLSRVLGPARTTVPLAWWSHGFEPDVLRSEAQRALAQGYVVHKFKRRAHTDVVEQVAAIADVAPAGYEITVDANETFGTVERAIDIGKQLKACPLVHCLESPVKQSDIEGYRQIRAALDLPLAHHIGAPDAIDALHSGVYDYFILGTSVAALQRDAHICGARERPFWMQLGGDGTDISTFFMLHLAAAIPNSTKGHVSMQHLQEATLLNEPIQVKEGMVTIPETPGLGVTLNMDVVDRYRV
jgi:L-alanine-DL-glutamate epimerase-like enolase superfamily enzyme